MVKIPNFHARYAGFANTERKEYNLLFNEIGRCQEGYGFKVLVAPAGRGMEAKAARALGWGVVCNEPRGEFFGALLQNLRRGTLPMPMLTSYPHPELPRHFSQGEFPHIIVPSDFISSILDKSERISFLKGLRGILRNGGKLIVGMLNHALLLGNNIAPVFGTDALKNFIGYVQYDCGNEKIFATPKKADGKIITYNITSPGASTAGVSHAYRFQEKEFPGELMAAGFGAQNISAYSDMVPGLDYTKGYIHFIAQKSE